MSLFNDYFKAVYVALDATTGLTGIISESLSNADPFPKIWIELNQEPKEAKSKILENTVTLLAGSAGSGKTLLS